MTETASDSMPEFRRDRDEAAQAFLHRYERYPDALRRLGAALSVADAEVAAWPKAPSAVRARAALLTELAEVAAEEAGAEARAVTIAARIAASADTARAAELAVGVRRRPNPTEGNPTTATL